MDRKKLTSCCVLLALGASEGYADDILSTEITESFRNGTASIGFRPRYEAAHQTGLKSARATTLRTTVGYETAEFSQSTIKVEVVDVSSMFGQRYNPAVSDLQRPEYVSIQDPRGTGVAEAKFRFNGLEKTAITVGRQYIRLDNERMVGKNDFRQYPQSFDAISIQNSMLENLDIYYAFANYVNTNSANGRAQEGRRKLHSHFANVDWSGFQYGNISVYAYFNKDRSVTTNSQVTGGVRLSAHNEYLESTGNNYHLEVARQQGRFRNPVKYNAYYWHGEAGKEVEAFFGSIGFESFSGHSTDAGKSFRTPLGSNHDFNGWSDVFVNIPNRGLHDLYLKVGAKHTDFKIYMVYHYFRLATGSGSRRAGQEIDVGFDVRLNDQVDFSIGYAKYNPKSFPLSSTRRFWMMLTASFI